MSKSKESGSSVSLSSAPTASKVSKRSAPKKKAVHENRQAKRQAKMESGGQTSGEAPHLNLVHLVGRVNSEPLEKILPSNDRVMEFRLVVVRDDGTGVDTLDIAVWNGAMRRTLRTLKVSETVTIEGVLRRRFWQGKGGLASRWQVEARQISRL